MIKAAGLLLIFSALTLTGFYFGERSRKKLYEMKRADDLLTEIINGVEEQRLSVNMIFDLIKNKTDEETSAFLNGVQTLIKKMSIEKLKECSLKTDFCHDEECIDALFHSFSVFGRISAEEQVSEIKACREKIRKHYADSEADIKERIKICRTLGVISGFCTVIILI